MEDDTEFWGEQLLMKSRMNDLRERLEAFVSENETLVDLK